MNWRIKFLSPSTVGEPYWTVRQWKVAPLQTQQLLEDCVRHDHASPSSANFRNAVCESSLGVVQDHGGELSVCFACATAAAVDVRNMYVHTSYQSTPYAVARGAAPLQ